MKFTYQPFTFFLIVFAFISCTKEGPAGPQGPAGAAGNANVKTVTFTNQAFTLNTLANVYQVLQTVPEITPAILQKGSVTMYIAKSNSSNADWTALPGNFSPDPVNAALNKFYNFSYSSSTATIYTTTNPGYNVDLKVVIVAGP